MAYDVARGLQTTNLLASYAQGLHIGNAEREVREARERENQLRTLAPRIIEGDPQAYNQAAAIDPNAAMAYQSAGDSQLRRLAGAVRYLDDARASGKPEAVNAALRTIGPFMSQLTGQPAPTEWTDDMGPEFESLKARIAMLGTPEGREGKVVGNNIVDGVTGAVIYQGPEPQVSWTVATVNTSDGGTQQVLLNPRTLETRPIPRPGSPMSSGGSYAGGGGGGGGPLQDSSIEKAIAELEAREGPLPEHVKEQLRQQMSTDNGQFTVANTPSSDDGWGYSPPRREAAPSGYRWGESGQLEVIPGGPADKPAADEKPPAGYRFAADGKTLEAIPGGPADRPRGQGAGRPLSGEQRMKLGMLRAARAAAENYAREVLPEGGGFNESALFVGPGGGYLDEAVNNVLRVESGAAVPPDETERGIARYGASVFNQESTARDNLRQLLDKIDILERELTGGAPADTAPAAPAPAAAPSAIRVINVRPKVQ